MGTNFYFENELTDGISERIHIGKRSAAGLYCFDCMVTLCGDGEDYVHQSSSDWNDVCPECGKKHAEETMEESSAGLELGFNKNPIEVKTGVKSCSSFTWAIKPNIFGQLTGKGKIKTVYDEYDRIISIGDMVHLLVCCPIHFYQSIGKEFS